MKKIRVLIIDDEPLARKRIRYLLDEDPSFEILGECADGRSAVIQIMECRPDLIFLDIRIPDISGFEVLQLIEPELMPRVIFVAADDRLERQALDVHLIDCLLKPISRVQFFVACQRIKDDILGPPSELSTAHLRDLLDDLRKRGALGYTRWLAAQTAQGFKLVPADDILWLGAEGPDICLHTERESHVIRRSLNEAEKILDPSKFLRISPAALVQVRAVRCVESGGGKAIVLVLRNAMRLEVSGAFTKRVVKRLHP